MPDAGSIWYESLSGIGKNLGRAIEYRQKKNQEYEAFSSFLSGGKDMTVPDIHGKMQPLISPKVLDIWTHENRAQQMKNMGGLEALQQVYQELAVAGAKARIQSENVEPVYDAGGRQIGERGGRGGLKVFPQWLVEGKTKNTAFNKALEKQGLTEEDFQNVDEDSLRFLDADKQALEIPKASDQPKITRPDVKRKPGSRELAEGVKPGEIDIMSRAKFISGTAGDKEFQMPVSEWRKLVNMSKSSESDRRIAPGARQVPVVKTPDEARKLPPGTLFKTPDGRYLRVPSRAPNAG